jgi:hypothetical protein
LLDDDPARERQLQLPGDDLASVDGALLQDADRGRIGQGLRQEKFSAVPAAALPVERLGRVDAAQEALGGFRRFRRDVAGDSAGDLQRNVD